MLPVPLKVSDMSVSDTTQLPASNCASFPKSEEHMLALQLATKLQHFVGGKAGTQCSIYGNYGPGTVTARKDEQWQAWDVRRLSVTACTHAI